MGWRYLAQNIMTGEWLHTDLPLSGVTITWQLSGPGSLDATIVPQHAAMLAKGALSLDEWSTAIYPEKDGVIRGGFLLVDSDVTGQSWKLTGAGFATYPTGIVYNGDPYVKTNYDPLNVVRDLWDYIQTRPSGDIGMVVDSTTSTQLVGNVKDDTGQVLDVPAQSKTAGVALEQWPSNSGDNQLWKLGTLDADGYQTIQNKNSGLMCGVSMSSKAAGALVIQYTADGKDSQKWMLVNHGSFYEIVNKNSGMLMNVNGASTKQGAAIIQWPVSDAENSEWNVSTPDTDGYVTIANMNTGVPAAYELDWWNATDIGQEIDTLAQNTPFDYWEEHAWNAARTNVTHRLRLGFPRAGARRSQLRFAEGENISDIVTNQLHGSNYANEIIALGAGSGSTMLRSYTQVQDGRPRRTICLQDASITDQSVLDALAQNELNSRMILPEVVSCTVRQHPNAVLGSFKEGDDILIQTFSGWAPISAWHRITSIAVQPDDPTYITLTLIRSDRFRYASGGLTGSTQIGS